jgi:hypothetical protein
MSGTNNGEIETPRTSKIRGHNEASLLPFFSVLRYLSSVTATPYDHPDPARWPNNLSIRFARRFELTGRMEDLREVVW